MEGFGDQPGALGSSDAFARAEAAKVHSKRTRYGSSAWTIEMPQHKPWPYLVSVKASGRYPPGAMGGLGMRAMTEKWRPSGAY